MYIAPWADQHLGNIPCIIWNTKFLRSLYASKPTCSILPSGTHKCWSVDKHLMLEIGGSKPFISGLSFEEYMYVGTNMHSTAEPVTKMSEWNLKLNTAPSWSRLHTNEPSFTFHTLQEGKCISAQLQPDIHVASQTSLAQHQEGRETLTTFKCYSCHSFPNGASRILKRGIRIGAERQKFWFDHTHF